MSIVIAFLAMIAVAVVLDRLRAVMTRRGVATWIWYALLGLILLLGTLDQTPRGLVPPYAALAANWADEAAYVNTLEARLPHGAMVYQTPYYPFPERGYEEARPYLHSKHLRWSFGAVEGRPEDWAAGLAGQPGGYVVPSVASVGFAGILVDRQLYPDAGKAADAGIHDLTGAAPIQSAHGRYSFYDLRPYAAALQSKLGADLALLRYRTLHPVRVVYGPQFAPALYAGQPPALLSIRSADGPRGTFQLVNPAGAARRVTVRADLGNEAGPPARAIVVWPDRAIDRVALPNAGVSVSHAFEVPAHGKVTVVILTDQPRTAIGQYFSLRNVSVTDETVAQIVQRAPALGAVR
jgi:phosphoglycerol transferase